MTLNSQKASNSETTKVNDLLTVNPVNRDKTANQATSTSIKSQLSVNYSPLNQSKGHL